MCLKKIEHQQKLFEYYLDKYREFVTVNSEKARGYIKRLQYKQNFYLLNCISQTYLDECRFENNSDVMRSEINFRKWRMAEKYAIEAFSINSNNAEILYTMGEVRKLNNQDDTAIYCFEKIIKTGVRKIAKQEYSRGFLFARELYNDTHFELYKLYYKTDSKKSKKYLANYLKGIKTGASTIFDPLNKFLLD